jgi:fructose-bisphosphate aldolase class II
MRPLRDVLTNAEQSRVAVGHFNVSELATLKGVVAAAAELNLPVVVGVSESEREFIGVHQMAALIRSIREESDLPVFLNADHTHSLDKEVAAAKAGFDCV